MKAVIRLIIKAALSIIVIIFFSGVFRGCASGSQTDISQGVGLLFASVLFIATLYGIWSFSTKK